MSGPESTVDLADAPVTGRPDALVMGLPPVERLRQLLAAFGVEVLKCSRLLKHCKDRIRF